MQGCGVSALVPLETAVARLADNGINITVIEHQELFNRDYDETIEPLLVNSQGQLVYFTEGGVQSFFEWDPEVQKYFVISGEGIHPIIEDWDTASLGTWVQGQNKTVAVYNVQYTFRYEDNYYVLTPAAGTYSE